MSRMASQIGMKAHNSVQRDMEEEEKFLHYMTTGSNLTSPSSCPSTLSSPVIGISS